MFKQYSLALRLVAPSAAILMLVLITACGGGDDKTDEGSNPTATNSSSGAEKTPAATDATGSDGSSDLSALAAEYGNFTGAVKYETSGFADSLTAMKIYKDKARSRVDYEGSDGSGSFITNADGSFACAENQCIKYPAGQGLDPTAAFTTFISAETIEKSYGDIPEGVDVKKSSRQIAGTDATCYTYSGDIDKTEAGDESGEICFAQSGLLLRLEFSGASGGGTFNAIQASQDVSEADFEPPFPITEIPGQ